MGGGKGEILSLVAVFVWSSSDSSNKDCIAGDVGEPGWWCFQVIDVATITRIVHSVEAAFKKDGVVGDCLAPTPETAERRAIMNRQAVNSQGVMTTGSTSRAALTAQGVVVTAQPIPRHAIDWRNAICTTGKCLLRNNIVSIAEKLACRSTQVHRGFARFRSMTANTGLQDGFKLLGIVKHLRRRRAIEFVSNTLDRLATGRFVREADISTPADRICIVGNAPRPFGDFFNADIIHNTARGTSSLCACCLREC